MTINPFGFLFNNHRHKLGSVFIELSVALYQVDLAFCKRIIIMVFGDAADNIVKGTLKRVAYSNNI